jgi:hypothetical protein
MLRDKAILGIHGQMQVRLYDPSGDLQLVQCCNTIVYTGYDIARKSIGLATGRASPANYIGIGSGASGVVMTDTGLGNELSRKLATFSATESFSGWQDKWELTVNFSGGEGTGTITESGVFNAVSGGSMFCRAVFAGVQKSAADSLEFKWIFTVSQP